MSKRRREKHDINLARTEPGSAKKMKISTRLRKPKADPRPDSNAASTAAISPECHPRVRSGRHRLNNSLSESETEIVWDGNSPTAHLQRRLGRNGRSKAGDISEIVQCVNSQTGSMESNSADMPLLGLWMTRSPNHPAVDLGVVRKTLAQQESSKPKSTHRKPTGRLSLLQAELEKIANAINNSVAKDSTGGQIEKENLSSPDENQSARSDERRIQPQETAFAEKQLPKQELKTEQVVRVQAGLMNKQQVSRQTDVSQLDTEKSITGRLPTTQPMTGHFGHGQPDSSRPTRSQPFTGQSVTGQSDVSRPVAGQSTSLSGQPKSSFSVAGQSIGEKSKSKTSQLNSGHSVSGHSVTRHQVTGHKSSVGCAAIGQFTAGQSATHRSMTGQSVNSKTNVNQLVTGKSTAHKSPPPIIGPSINPKSNTTQFVCGQFSAGQSSAGQSSCSQATGRLVQSKSDAGSVVTVHSNTMQCSTLQSTGGQSVHTSNSGRLATGHTNIGQSFSGHSLSIKSNVGLEVTCQPKLGLSSTSQSTTSQSVHGKSTSGRSVTGHSSTGPMTTSHPNTSQSFSNKSTLSSGQITTSLPNIAKSVSGQSNSGHLVAGQSIKCQLSTTQSANGQIVSAKSNAGHFVAGQPNTSQSSKSYSNTSQSNSGQSTTGQSTLGRSFIFKSKTGQSVPCQSVVPHRAINDQSNIRQATKNHISKPISTNHQSTSKKTVTSLSVADNDDSLWDGCDDFDDEILLEQLSQAEAMETCNTVAKQQSSNGSLQTNQPANNSNLQEDASNQAIEGSVTRQARNIVATTRTTITPLVNQPSSNETLKTNLLVTSSISTNKFSFKREASNQNKQVTSVTRPVTSTISSSTSCVSVKANVGHPVDRLSPKESLQINKPDAGSIPTNKFSFKREAGNPNKSLTSATRPVTSTVRLSSKCVSVTANNERLRSHQSPNEPPQTSKPVTSRASTNNFSFQRQTSHQTKVHSTTKLATDTVSSSTNSISKMTAGPPLVQEPDLDPFDTSLTDDMLVSMCAGLDSPLRQPSTISDSKPANSTMRTSATSVISHQKSSSWQPPPSRSATSVPNKPATVSSAANPKPLSTQTAGSQKVCSQSEIEKKRQQAMARRKKHGNGGGTTAILKRSVLPPR